MKSFAEVTITTKSNKPYSFEGTQEEWIEQVKKDNAHSRRLKDAYIQAGGVIVETKRVENQKESSWEGWEYKIGFPTDEAKEKANQIHRSQKSI